MIRFGHQQVNDYRMSFFKIALEEFNDYISENIRYNALSHRLSKLEQDDFDKFMNEGLENEVESEPLVIDHEANIRQMRGL